MTKCIDSSLIYCEVSFVLLTKQSQQQKYNIGKKGKKTEVSSHEQNNYAG